jgi:acyl-coenzyme A synthetase/AMP-(fatty) acid ligase
VLLSDPRVWEAKVLAVQEEHYGEEICACVVPAAGVLDRKSNQRLGGGFSLRILGYQNVVFLRNFPGTSSGKISLSEHKNI